MKNPYEYSLIFRTHTTKFFTLKNCLNELCRILDAINVLDIIDSGEFITTSAKFIPNKEFVKRYRISLTVPSLEVTIFKESKGNIDKEQFLIDLKRAREDYENFKKKNR